MNGGPLYCENEDQLYSVIFIFPQNGDFNKER